MTYKKWKQHIETYCEDTKNVVLTYTVSKKDIQKIFRDLHDATQTTITLTYLEEILRRHKTIYPQKTYTHIESTSALQAILYTKNTITGFCSETNIVTGVPLILARLYCLHTWNAGKTNKITLHIHSLKSPKY